MQSQLIPLIAEYLKSNSAVEFAYLFGSFAKGEQRDSSDIDIAVYLKENNLDTLLQLTYELSKLSKRDADIVVLNSAKNLFLIESILNDGIVLKDNPKRVDYELAMEHNILDFKEFRRYLDAI